MIDLCKLILFAGGIGSLIMVAVGLSQLPSQSQQIVSDSSQAAAVSAANNQDVVNSRGFILTIIGSGMFISINAFYVYFFSDVCRREEDILREVNAEITAAQVLPLAVAVAGPVAAPVSKPILKVTRAPGAPRAPVPFPPRPIIGPIYGHNAEVYRKSMAQRYPGPQRTV
jgi:Na+-transporting methylmalonyl-CoA/oxaloacetate decarboxylase gamma subunit